METMEENDFGWVYTSRTKRMSTDEDGTVHTITEEIRRVVPKLPALPPVYRASITGTSAYLLMNEEHPFWKGEHPCWRTPEVRRSMSLAR